jgi:DNA-binding NtrC family response regulator
MIKPGKDDKLVVAVIAIMAGVLFAAVGFSAFLQAAGRDLGVLQFLAGYTLVLGGIGHLMHRSQVKLIRTILHQSQEMIHKAEQK